MATARRRHRMHVSNPKKPQIVLSQPCRIMVALEHDKDTLRCLAARQLLENIQTVSEEKNLFGAMKDDLALLESIHEAIGILFHSFDASTNVDFESEPEKKGVVLMLLNEIDCPMVEWNINSYVMERDTKQRLFAAKKRELYAEA